MNELSEFSNLLFTLQTKGMEIFASFEGKPGELRFVKFYFSPENLYGWKDLINRMNVVYDNAFNFIVQDEEIISGISSFQAALTFLTDPSNIEKLEKETSLIVNAVELDEYKSQIYCAREHTFDLKLGISCNNNCIHCVIKPQIRKMQERNPESIVLDSGIGMQSALDLNYRQVIDTLSQQTQDSTHIVLTGGEPTIREDFIPIVKWLYYNRPNGTIALQTNGRNMANKDLVKALRRYTRTISIIVALHGMEETHNKVVNNRKETGNPFKETVQGIRNMLEVFPAKLIRILTVLTSLNIGEVLECVSFQYEELGVKSISITYPDFPEFSAEQIKNLTPPTDSIISVLKELNEYAKGKGDLDISVIDIPPCFFNQLGDEIKLNALGFIRNNISINFLGNQNDEYDDYCKIRFNKSDKCSRCILTENCTGVYPETKDLREPFMEPILEMTPGMHNFLKRAGWPAF